MIENEENIVQNFSSSSGEESDEFGIYDERPCLYASISCESTNCITKDEDFHIVFCSEECRGKYIHHKQKLPLVKHFHTDTFIQLWRLHVSLTTQLIIELVADKHSHNTAALIKEISYNDRALSNQMGSFYDDGGEDGSFAMVISALLIENVVMSINVVKELLTEFDFPDEETIVDIRRYTKRDNTAYTRWFEQGISIAETLSMKINPQSDDLRRKCIDYMTGYTETTLAEMVFIINGHTHLAHNQLAYILEFVVKFAKFLIKRMQK